MSALIRCALLTLAAALLSATATSAASLRELVETEYAFAQSAEENGMRYAYLYYVAPDAIGFNPEPSLLRPHWESRLPSRDRLRWYPVHAEINAAGDLGFTTGPWTYTSVATGNTGYGEFVTIWRHSEPDGWRLALQAGVTHEAPRRIAKAVRSEHFSNRTLNASAGDTAQITSRFDDCDNRYGEVVIQQGAATAMAQFGRRDLRSYTLGQPVARDRKSSVTLVAGFTGAKNQLRKFTGVGGSQDLAFTYGNMDFSVPGPQHYLRIWRMHASRCELALELLRPQALPRTPLLQ